MRLIYCAFLPVLLAACASQGPNSRAVPVTSPIATWSVPFQQPEAYAVGDAERISLFSTDLWERIRRGFQMPDLTGELVVNQTAWYAQRPDYVQRIAQRSGRYLYHIVEELDRRRMPIELALLPFIESAYNPQALSIAKAAGMWQFIPGTGRDYKLRQNMFQDERRDVLASTSAALDYLSRLHTMFGDWHLALAAYNWGEGNVQRAIARNRARGLATDYQSLTMPKETRQYVPKLQAVKNLIANPQLYGLILPAVPDLPYFVTVTAVRDIDVNLAAKLAGMPLKEFRALNPSFSKPVILGAIQPVILLPFENAALFERNLQAFEGELSSWTTYTVDELARPNALAAKLGVDPVMLMAVNKIPSGVRLRPGSTVLVPKVELREHPDISAKLFESAVLRMEPDAPKMRNAHLTQHAVKSPPRATTAQRGRAASVRLQVHAPSKHGKLVAARQLRNDSVPKMRISYTPSLKNNNHATQLAHKKTSTQQLSRNILIKPKTTRLSQLTPPAKLTFNH